MTAVRLNRIAAIVPLIFSAFAFAIVMANILTGVPPQPDENASAHVWQVLMVLQLPLMMLFLVTADWHRRATAAILVLQLLGIALACLPVWMAGY